MRPEEVGDFVAARLRHLREERGLSLRQLANRSDLTPEMLSRAERGQRTPALETIARVCEGLSISIADFFTPKRERVTRVESIQTLPRVVRVNMDEFLEVGLNDRAREHFLDAIRSIERGMKAQEQGGAQRRRTKPK